eukprot:TRINITY_DN4318_c0_g1_i1.p1 TRINITY_DN4318_c0_g1~~TRINITY_DN4318_c0_g1_i1.p1  ORF type:complete len:134 (+),score=12.50 TRINITY_DN4318_c0_g1_i1:2-403(+)
MMSQRFGFESHCKVVAFTGDNPASLAGLGLCSEDEIGVSLGTSDTVFGALRSPHVVLNGHILTSCVDPEGYMFLLCFKNGSSVRQKIRDAVCGSGGEFGSLLEKTRAGSNGLVAFYFDQEEILPKSRSGFYLF